MKPILSGQILSRSILLTLTSVVLTTAVCVRAQTVFFSDNFNRADSLDLDAATNGFGGLLFTNGTLTASNVWLEPIDVGRNVPGDSQIITSQLRLGGNGHSVNLVLDKNFATVMSTGLLSISIKLNGTPGPNDTSALHRYEGIGFGFGRAEGNVVSSTVDRVLSRAADVFVAGTANGKIRINDEAATSRPATGDLTPTTTVPAASGATTFVAGTLRLDLTITNGTAGSTVTYAVLFDAGSTGNFTTLANRAFVLSDNFQFYLGIEQRSTPSVFLDDLSISATGAYGPPISAGLFWRGQISSVWDTTTANWFDSDLGTAGVYTNGASVTFDDNASNTTVNVSTALTPGNMAFGIINSNYVVTGSGSLGGNGILSKTGAGTVTMALSNSYAGGTVMGAGRIRVGNDYALGTGLISLNGGALSSDGTTSRTLNNPIQIATATLGNATDTGVLTMTSPVDFAGGAPAVTVASDVVFANGSTNGRIGSKIGKGTLTIRGNVNYNGAADVQNGTVIFDGATVTDSDRLIVDTATFNGIARLVITNGASVTVNTSVGNLRSGRAASTGTNYLDLAGLYQLPGADSVDGNLTLQANAADSEVTFWPGGDFAARSVALNGTGSGNTVFKFNGGILRARNDNATFFEGLSQTLIQSGGANIDDGGFNIIINQNFLDGGGGGLNKIGAGTLRLNGNNTYTGDTVISNGIFGGSGTINGAVKILAGATLSPGAAAATVGTLTINSNLALNAGSSVLMDVNKDTTSKDFIAGVKNINYDGTLVINNLGSMALAPGDSFALFNAVGTKSGNFSSVTFSPVTALPYIFDPASGTLTMTALAAGTDLFNVLGNSLNNILPVLTNDLGNGLSLVGVAQPAHGTAVISGTNILYSPAAGYVGSDTFSYTNQDNLASQTVLTVYLTVTAVPNFNDKYQVLHDSHSNVLAVLRNDGAGTSLVSVMSPTNGTVAISGTNILYTPTAGYYGADHFYYTSQDSSGADTVSQVTVDVRQYPNFVFILADDQGWTGLSVLMDTNRPNSKSDYYHTPEMEKFATQATRFSYGYAPHPNCSPSRYAILTGKTPARTRLTDIIGRNNAPTSGEYKLITPGKSVDALQASDKTIVELLKTIPGAGYSAAHFGKWHLAGGGPVAHGFDADANDGATGNDDGDLGSSPINADPKQAYGMTDRALNYLDLRVTNGVPFYLQVSHYAVHETTQTSQASYDAFNGVPKGVWHNNQYYAGMTLDLDVNVGRLLDKLDELGIRNSTYVMYEGDNGAPQAQSENYPLRGYKPEIWEGGDRVPMFIRGPGVPANSQCNTPVVGIDFFPTIWQWATGSLTNLPPDVDGGSLVPLINSMEQGSNTLAAVVRGGDFVHHSPHYVGPSPWPNDWILNDKDMRPRSSIHVGHYKLVANYEPGTLELYDLDNDIAEQTNLSPAQLAIKWQLWVRLRDYLKMVNAQMPTLDPTYPGTTNGDFVLAGATGPLGDADSDGLDDSWEFRELLTYQFNGNDDPDHDGVSNAQELAQGTDPLVPNAYRIDTITEVAPDQLHLTWNATPGASFVVESSTNLVDWVPAQTVTAGDVFSGSVTVQKTQPQEFFRVRKL